MLPRAQARARKRKGAEPRSPAAHTRGSARGLERRRRLLTSTPRPTPRTPVRQVMSPKMRLGDKTSWRLADPSQCPPAQPPGSTIPVSRGKCSQVTPHLSPSLGASHIPIGHLSEEEQESPGRQGGVSPKTTRARSKNAGAHRAREPVTKATAVKPSEDRMKLGLRRKGDGAPGVLRPGLHSQLMEL